jgi:hypothetical protein
MKLRRKVAAIVLFAAIFVGTETGGTAAQQGPPDLRMLMNLDLFEPRSPGQVGGQAAPAASPTNDNDSMLDQIRTLDEMGYLGNHNNGEGNGAPAPRSSNGGPPAQDGGAPAPNVGVPAPAPPSTQQAPSSQPSFDAEGPEP